MDDLDWTTIFLLLKSGVFYFAKSKFKCVKIIILMVKINSAPKKPMGHPKLIPKLNNFKLVFNNFRPNSIPKLNSFQLVFKIFRPNSIPKLNCFKLDFKYFQPKFCKSMLEKFGYSNPNLKTFKQRFIIMIM